MATPKDALLLLPGILPSGWVLIPGCAKEEEEEEEPPKTPLKKEGSMDIGGGSVKAEVDPVSCNGETTTTTTSSEKNEEDCANAGGNNAASSTSSTTKDVANDKKSSSPPPPNYTSICLLHVDLDMETWSAGCDKVVVMKPEKNAKPRRSRTHFWSYVIKDLTAGRVPLTPTVTGILIR